MNVLRTTILFFSLAFCCFSAFAQSHRNEELLQHLSRKDLHEYLLYKSKKEKSRAIGAATIGPLLTGVGLYLLNKEKSAPAWQSNSPNQLYGTLLSSLGIVVSVSSISLFVSASQTKKQAQRLLSAQPVSLLYNRVPEIGVQIRF